MRIVVVGGQARKVGKTSVAAGLIRRLREFEWVAVKISQHAGQAPDYSMSADCAGTRSEGFVLKEETCASPATDTGRFLIAGAKRALRLCADSGRMREAVSALVEALAGEQYVMVESTRALNMLAPDISIVVVDLSRHEVKPDFSRALRRADALVEVSRGAEGSSPSRRFVCGAHRFAVGRKNFVNSRLCTFVRWRLHVKTA